MKIIINDTDKYDVNSIKYINKLEFLLNQEIKSLEINELSEPVEPINPLITDEYNFDEYSKVDAYGFIGYIYSNLLEHKNLLQNLSALTIGDDDFEDDCRKILSNNSIFKNIINLLKNTPNLNSINISGLTLNPKQTIKIIETIKNLKLTTVNLSSCYINKEVAKKIAELLANESLEELYVGYFEESIKNVDTYAHWPETMECLEIIFDAISSRKNPLKCLDLGELHRLRIFDFDATTVQKLCELIKGEKIICLQTNLNLSANSYEIEDQYDADQLTNMKQIVAAMQESKITSIISTNVISKELEELSYKNENGSNDREFSEESASSQSLVSLKKRERDDFNYSDDDEEEPKTKRKCSYS